MHTLGLGDLLLLHNNDFGRRSCNSIKWAA